MQRWEDDFTAAFGYAVRGQGFSSQPTAGQILEWRAGLGRCAFWLFRAAEMLRRHGMELRVTDAQVRLGLSDRFGERYATRGSPQIEQVATFAGGEVLPYAGLAAGQVDAQAFAGITIN